MSALAQSRDVTLRLCVIYKTPFLFHYHQVLNCGWNATDLYAKDVFFYVYTYIRFHLKRVLNNCSSKILAEFVNDKY